MAGGVAYCVVVAEVAVEVIAEVLVELTASGLGYHLQIWLVVPVV